MRIPWDLALGASRSAFPVCFGLGGDIGEALQPYFAARIAGCGKCTVGLSLAQGPAIARAALVRWHEAKPPVGQPFPCAILPGVAILEISLTAIGIEEARVDRAILSAHSPGTVSQRHAA